MSNCNICSSNQYKILYKHDYSYVICKQCGHVFQSNRKESIHYHELPYESQWNNYMNHSKNRANYIIDFLPEDTLVNVKKVIDIGCGPGGVLYYLNQKFPIWEINGITAPSDKDKMIKGINVIYDDFENYSFKEKYDFAILCHVLEHFINPLDALNKINSILNNDGILYIEVPSFLYAEVRSDPQFCPVHLSYFSKKKIIQLLEYNGFKILKIKESKYWGNIKILAKKDINITNNNFKENYIFKLIKWKINKNIVNKINKFIKKYKKIKPND